MLLLYFPVLLGVHFATQMAVTAAILANVSAALLSTDAAVRVAHMTLIDDAASSERSSMSAALVGNASWPCLSGMPLWPIPIINAPYCDPGYYCPHIYPNISLSYPSFCFPTMDCAETRMKSQFCEPQGYFEPQLCLPGYYCPNFTMMLPCPAGTYCIRGTSAPAPCPALSYCPDLTNVRRFYGGIVYSIIIDLVMAALYVFVRFYYEPLQSRKRSHESTAKFARDSSTDLEALVAAGRAFELSASPRKSPEVATLEDGSNGVPDYAEVSAVELVSAKSVLEDGFRKCNARLKLDLKFENLGLTLPPPMSKTILSGVRGRIRPGRVTAVMGPSGAGKTTFLSVLMGKVGRTAGSLNINGEQDEMYRYQKIIGYVPQEDTMIRECTVRENILFSARMRLPRTGWTDADVQRHVDAVIEVLGLSGCADTLIGDVTTRGVSGGQRKRTNIGIEMAVAPAAIFLDEPTSGLDSNAALEVCKTLRSIADLGLTVVAVIHQPRLEIFNTFDDLLLLAPGGVTAYIGPRAGVIPYFQELGYTFSAGNNPADQLLDFVAGTNFAAVSATLATQGSDGTSGDADASRASDADGTFVAPGSSAMEVMDAPLLTDDAAKEDLSKFTNPMYAPLTKFFSRQWALRGSRYEDDHGVTSAIADAMISPPSSGAAAVPHASNGVANGVASVALNASDGALVRPNPDVMSADRGATLLRQIYLCHNRSVLQQYRQISTYALEMGVCLLAGGVMGAAASQFDELYQGVLQQPYTPLSPSPMEVLIPSLGLYIVLAIGIAGSPAGVLTFGEEKTVYYREAAAGHSKLAYYIGKTVSVVYRFTFGALHFAGLFMVLASPITEFGTFYGLVWIQFFAVYGLAAMVSMIVKRENAALLAVIVSLIAGCMCGYGPSLAQMNDWGLGWVLDLSFARWAAEAWFHCETAPYRHVYMVKEVSAMLFGYTVDRLPLDIGLTILIGTVYRVVAYFGLVLINRDKQR